MAIFGKAKAKGTPAPAGSSRDAAQPPSFASSDGDEDEGKPPADAAKTAFADDEDRHCTDVFCLVLFCLMWVVLFLIAAVGFFTGEPARLLYGTDRDGRTCGAGNFSTQRNIYYPQLQQDLIAAAMKPHLYQPPLGDPTSIPLVGVCQQKCPKRGDIITDGGDTWTADIDTKKIFFRCLPWNDVERTLKIRCVEEGENGTAVPDYRSPWIWCDTADKCEELLQDGHPNCTKAKTIERIETDKPAKTDPVMDQLQGWAMTVQRGVGDVMNSAVPVMLCGGLLAFVNGVIFLTMVRCCPKPLVWSTVFLMMAMLVGLTLYFAHKAGLLQSSLIADSINATATAAAELPEFPEVPPSLAANYGPVYSGTATPAQTTETYTTLTYVMIAVDAVCFLMIIALRKRVMIAVGIIRQASRAIKAMPLLVLFPLIPCAVMIAVMVYWLVVAAYIASAGSVGANGALTALVDDTGASVVVGDSSWSADDDVTIASQQGQTSEDDTMVLTQNPFLLHLFAVHSFGLLWTVAWIKAWTVCTIAGAVSRYYFTADKRRGLDHFAVVRSAYRALRYHAGSLAFGAFIIAVVQSLRFALEYVDRQTKDLQKANKWVRFALLCLKVCMYLFEKCVKYVSKNGYIIIAMRGYSFCPAVVESFRLIWANLKTVGTVNLISSVMLLVAKLAIIAISLFAMFGMVNGRVQLPTFFMGELEEVTSPALPLLVTLILSYAMSSYLLEVLGMAIDTILLCFCEDLKMNKDTHHYFASEELTKFIQGAKPLKQYKRHKVDPEDDDPGSTSSSDSDADGDHNHHHHNPVHGGAKTGQAREVTADQVHRRVDTNTASPSNRL